MNLAAALSAGLVAGLALALPLGAVGALLFATGLRHGFAHGWPAAAGVASVDALYCALAVTLGALAAPAIRALAPWPAVAGGVAVIAIAVLGFARARRAAPDGDPGAGVAVPGPGSGTAVDPGSPDPGTDPAPAPGTASARGPVAPPRRMRRYLAFVALTLVNPLTLLYFAAIAAGSGELLAGTDARIAFTAGVLLGSLLWQLVLVGAGALLSARLPRRVTRLTLLAGNVLVAALGLSLLLGALSG
ncbi:LysE family transporter [Leucobacter massiliensis]|uniref:Lysine transporter LysE n=1 Tax=Leucobacter massiliensis TaxID=1686285 RepID=A0A2S9QKC0_9MICO|nr:LysE family transporter [Leucobacter massiliensis]PRI10033.1 hypothetical protein B4915_14010 [Leucobacter massiliensis]PRI10054.1 hypothetical protein B4915_14145 [Leucobacter massiliensis]